jgi:hypothetical protein
MRACRASPFGTSLTVNSPETATDTRHCVLQVERAQDLMLRVLARYEAKPGPVLQNRLWRMRVQVALRNAKIADAAGPLPGGGPGLDEAEADDAEDFGGN